MAGTLDDLKNRIHELPLSEVLGKYIPLHRIGPQTKAVCPFHDDHDPSLQINDNKGFWYCFVDQMGGDAIKFVQLYKNIAFKEALADICDSLGWDFQDYITERKSNPKHEMGKRILTKASQLYKKMAETEKYTPFQEFLQKRHLNSLTVQTYSLGFAPKGNSLAEYLQSIPNQKDRKFALDTALELGVIRLSQYGDKLYYDQFRERIMFPIWDSFGQVIGFTSRASLADQKPKYLNSIDSFLFNKHNLLYGLHLAKKAIRDQSYLILVEGNMDQIALHQAGFQNAVAIMGTGFRDSSATRILGLTQNIYLCFDNDQGGWGAGERANKLFMQQGITPRHIDLHPHKDPDEFIQAEGRLEFQKRIDEASIFIDVQIEKSFPQEIPEVPERKLEVLTNFFEMLSPLKKTLSATERVTSLAKRLGLQSDSATIIRNYENYLNKQKQYNPIKKEKTQTTSKELDKPNTPPSLETAKKENPKQLLSRVEKTLLQNLVQYPELLTNEKGLELLDFVQSSEVKTYILGLRELMYEIDETEYVSVVKSLIEGDEYSLDLTTTAAAALYKYRDTDLNEKIAMKMIEDLKRKLQEEKLKTKKQEIKKQQKNTQTEEENRNLLNELLVIDRQLAELKIEPRKRNTT